jgi:hypothetical protein
MLLRFTELENYVSLYTEAAWTTGSTIEEVA